MTTTLLAAVAPSIAAAAGPGSGVRPAAVRPGVRETVALFGDSVTESYLVPNFLRYGLAPQLDRAESAFGFDLGGAGLIPAAPYRFHFNSWVTAETGPIPANGWAMIGNELTPGFDGPNAYGAVTTSSRATATTTVSNRVIQVLYTTTAEHCPFTVTAAGRTWTIDPYRPGLPLDVETPAFELPPGRHQLTVHGPACGSLWFNGVVARRPLPATGVQLEVDNLGHSGKLPWVDFNPRVEQSLVEQGYDVSVFLYGYIGELLGTRSLTAPYLNVMTTRARLARLLGGDCLIVQPTPIMVPAAAVRLVSRLDRQVARTAGCTYTTVLAHLWPDAATAERRGLVLVDGVHPTAAGYRLIAKALAPVLARILDARVAGDLP